MRKYLNYLSVLWFICLFLAWLIFLSEFYALNKQGCDQSNQSLISNEIKVPIFLYYLSLQIGLNIYNVE